jgi:hypothetical protein
MRSIKDLIEELRAHANRDAARTAFLDLLIRDAADALERVDTDSTLHIEWTCDGDSESRWYRLAHLRSSETIQLPVGHGSITVHVSSSQGKRDE